MVQNKQGTVTPKPSACVLSASASLPTKTSLLSHLSAVGL